MNRDFEATIRTLTQPLNGQYPRPWLTRLADPRQAKVFIVGKNQAKTFAVAEVGSHERFLDALFNRHGQSCRGLYDRITGGRPSPTRTNTDRLVRLLERAGVREVLETNVICYSTPLSEDLAKPIHLGGRQRGDEIFRTLLAFIRPPVLIAHGADTRRILAKALGAELPECPSSPAELAVARIDGPDYRPWVFVLPSLAPPAFNQWSGWAEGYLIRLAQAVAERLGTETNQG